MSLNEFSTQLSSPLNNSEISNSSAAFLKEEPPNTSYLQSTPCNRAGQAKNEQKPRFGFVLLHISHRQIHVDNMVHISPSHSQAQNDPIMHLFLIWVGLYFCLET